MSGKLDKVAHAICPKIKPWMDAEGIERHPCRKCKPRWTNYGMATPLCLKVARDIAKVAEAALSAREGA